MLHQDLWRAILEEFPTVASPSTSVTERLVTPGQLCLPSLAATLCFWGGSVTPQQLAAASVQELKVGVCVERNKPGQGTQQGGGTLQLRAAGRLVEAWFCMVAAWDPGTAADF